MLATDSITDIPSTPGSSRTREQISRASVPLRRLIGATIVRHKEPSSDKATGPASLATSPEADNYSRDPSSADSVPVGKADGIEIARGLIEAAHVEMEQEKAALSGGMPK